MAIINGTGGADTITPAFVSAGVTGGAPSDADDTIYGAGGTDLIDAGGGNDLIDIRQNFSFFGQNQVLGQGFFNQVLGGAGDDTVLGNANVPAVTQVSYAAAPAGVLADMRFGIVLDGWGGRDLLVNVGVVEGSSHADTLVAAGAIIFRGGDGNDYLRSIGGNATLEGGAGNDLLIGGTGGDMLDGGTGNDTLIGGEGSDTYSVAAPTVIIEQPGGGEQDQIFAQVGTIHLPGGVELLSFLTDADVLGVGNALDNLIESQAGNDRLLGGGGADFVRGLEGNDTLWGGSGDDQLEGWEGNDLLIGGTEADTLAGGDGADSLYGGAGDDALLGGEGADRLIGNEGNDTIEMGAGDTAGGGAGDDLYITSDAAAPIFEAAGGGQDRVVALVSLYLPAQVEELALRTAAGFGVGNALDNLILDEGAGNLLLGGAGNDTIAGGGWDTMFGQSGADVFAIAPGPGLQLIGDFTPGEDRLDLRGFGFESFAEVQALMMQGPTGTAILFDPVDRLMLNGVTASALHESDVVLA